MPTTENSAEQRKANRIRVLKEDLAAVEEELAAYEKKLQFYYELKAEKKNLTATIAREENNQPKPKISKAVIQPQVEELLRDNGELTEEDLKQLITERLRNEGVAATGLHSVIKALRNSFADGDVWRLPVAG